MIYGRRYWWGGIVDFQDDFQQSNLSYHNSLTGEIQKLPGQF